MEILRSILSVIQSYLPSPRYLREIEQQNITLTERCRVLEEEKRQMFNNLLAKAGMNEIRVDNPDATTPRPRVKLVPSTYKLRNEIADRDSLPVPVSEAKN